MRSNKKCYMDGKCLCKLSATRIIVVSRYISIVPHHQLARLKRFVEAGLLMTRNTVITSD